MIRALYTLKNKYQGKKIYIWDVNRDSIGMFAKAVFREINIDGFVTPQEEYAGETFMNRPILSLRQLEQNEDFMIIASGNVDKNRIASLETKVVYWLDSLALNEELKSKKLIVYGTGAGSKSLCRELMEDNIIPDLFCVTKLDSNSQQDEKRVIEASKLNAYAEYVVVISVKKTQYIWEILETLSSFQGLVYVDTGDLICEMDLVHMNFMQSIAYAVKRNKSIYLYSQRNAVSNFLEDVLNRYNVKISGYTYDQENQSKDIQSIYALALEGTEDKIIIVNENNPLQIIKARENVELAGFSLEDRNYISLQWNIRLNDEMLLGKLKEYKDPLLGGSILYSEGCPGWKVYGKEEENRIRMIILGGSTSSEVYHPENWISKLYDKLDSNGVKIIIYNGAHAGNDIVSEILRLLRDGFVLKPDLVINMSGFNNLCYKAATNQFNEERLLRIINAGSICSGVYNDESLYLFWARNEKLLKLISEFYGAKFFGFLQPMNCTMEYENLWEKSLYETENRIIGSRDFAKLATDDEEYINLMNLFEHRDEMYFDICHYTNKGHELIADEVYKIIEPTVMELAEQKHGENKGSIY